MRPTNGSRTLVDMDDGEARGRALRIAGVGILTLYFPDLLVLGGWGVWVDGVVEAVEAVGVLLGLGAVTWLGWRWPGFLGMLLLGVGLLTLLFVIPLLAFVQVDEKLAVALLLLLAPPPLAGTVFLASHVRAEW